MNTDVSAGEWAVDSVGYGGIYGIRGTWLLFLRTHHYLNVQSGMQAYYSLACMGYFLAQLFWIIEKEG